jgi:hypothetical protein
MEARILSKSPSAYVAVVAEVAVFFSFPNKKSGIREIKYSAKERLTSLAQSA